MAEVRNNWEGQIINGFFPLRRFLGSSGHSSVFLTESSVEGFLNAAIKIVPADPERSQVQLWQWKTAATFSHPHLIRLLDSGQCEIDGQSFLFVVMEYAEESLSQILPYRALGPDEVRELLVPTLDALVFLHNENWVQGQLKPSNFLVVNDQLKLATDTIRPVAVSPVVPRRPSIYDPPETDEGNVSAASDIWALGVTMTEALTQYPPTWLSGRTEPATLPTNLPPTFVDTVQQCLSVNPADRPSIAELQVQTKPGAPASQPQQAAPPPRSVARPASVVLTPPAAPPQTPEPAIRADVRPYPELEEESKRGVLVPALIALVVVGGAVWGGTRLFRGHSTQQVTTASEPTAPGESTATETPAAADTSAPEGDTTTAAPPARPGAMAGAPLASATPTRPDSTTAAPPTQRPPKTSASVNLPPAVDTASTVAGRSTNAPATRASRGQSPPADGATATAAVHEEIPTVSVGARSTIRGHVRVGVRVTVDSSGRVVRDTLDNPGPSKFFNRVASEAARKWRFAAADDRGPREWVLRFEFGRDGTTVHAVGPRS